MWRLGERPHRAARSRTASPRWVETDRDDSGAVGEGPNLLELSFPHEATDHLLQCRRDGRNSGIRRNSRAGQTVLDYLEAGESLDDFLEGFPTVSREQVIAFLEEAKDLLVAKAS